MPIFRDSENKAPKVIIEPCDAIYCVTNFSVTYAKGSAKVPPGTVEYNFTFEIEGKGAEVDDRIFDLAITQWRLDTFLKSAGVVLVKDEAFEFSKEKAEEMFVKWVNPIGLRGHCHVKKEPWDKEPGRFSNKIGIFYTDRAKLPRREIPQADDVNY